MSLQKWYMGQADYQIIFEKKLFNKGVVGISVITLQI